MDHYFNSLFIPADEALEQTLASVEKEGMPAISVAPNQGKFLHIIARSIRARSILEVGTLAGYSTIWLARALPADGLLVTLEADAKHAAVARANITRAGLSERVKILEGPALDSMPGVAEGEGPPFDLVFIDADKVNNAEYFRWALRLTKPGSLIIVDNVVRDGNVIDSESSDSSIAGVRRVHDEIAAESRVVATAIQTVGMKGYDGFTIALVT